MQIAHAPDWAQAVRLFITFMLTTGLGMHAFYRFRVLRETASPKMWAFFLYSLVFLFSCSLNFLSLLVTVATRTYGPIPHFHLGPFTVTLVITYAAFAFTARPTIERTGPRI
jgi:hypothetical protein